MNKNVGGIDKILRIVVGLALIATVFLGPLGIWGWIGIVPLVTGLFNFCPLYSIIGLSTCSSCKDKDKDKDKDE